MQTEGAYTTEVMILMEYAESKNGPLINTPTSHKLNSPANS
jgi:hypothetical protein